MPTEPPSTERTAIPTERALGRRDAMLRGATELAMTLVGCESDQEALDTAARVIGRSAAADRVVISEALRTSKGTFVQRIRAVWRADGAEGQAADTDLSRADRDLSAIDRASSEMDLVSGAGVYLSKAESDVLAGVDVEDLVSVPVLVAGQWWGSVGVFDHDPDGSWTPAATDILQTAANALGATLGLQAARRVVRRASARQRASEQAQARDLERFRALARGAPDAMALVDTDGCVRYANPAVEEVLGVPSEVLVGNVLADRLHPDDRARCAWNLAALGRSPGATLRFECRTLHGDGSLVRLEIKARNALRVPEVGAYVLALREISERRRIWRGATGARGRALATATAARLEGTDPIVAALNGRAPARAVDLAALLDGAASDDVAVRAVLDLWPVVGTHAALQALLGEVLAIARACTGDGPESAVTVEAHNVRIVSAPGGAGSAERRPPSMPVRPAARLSGPPMPSEDVFDSVSAELMSEPPSDASVDAVAARFAETDDLLDDSLAAASESVVSLDESLVSLAAASLEASEGPGPGAYAVVAVVASGGETLAPSDPRLELVKAVVGRLGGSVQLDEGVDGGRRIELWLLRAAEGSSTDPGAPGPGTIVVLEGEPAVRDLVERMLRRLHYAVFVTADPQEALVRAAAADVVLLLCPVVLPGISGPELARRVRAVRPGLPAVYTAGRLDEARRIDRRGAGRLLLKPFTLDGLAERIAAALG